MCVFLSQLHTPWCHHRPHVRNPCHRGKREIPPTALNFTKPSHQHSRFTEGFWHGMEFPKIINRICKGLLHNDTHPRLWSAELGLRNSELAAMRSRVPSSPTLMVPISTKGNLVIPSLRCFHNHENLTFSLGATEETISNSGMWNIFTDHFCFKANLNNNVYFKLSFWIKKWLFTVCGNFSNMPTWCNN